MERNTKIIIGFVSALAVGTLIYFGFINESTKIIGKKKEKDSKNPALKKSLSADPTKEIKVKPIRTALIKEILDEATRINGTPIPKERYDELSRNLSFMSTGELEIFNNTVKKKERDWTPEEKITFIALAKQYKLKIGG